MAVDLPDPVSRSSPLQLSPWMLQLAAERDGELVIVVPISMGTVYERIIGGQYWLRVNVSHEEHHVGQGF